MYLCGVLEMGLGDKQKKLSSIEDTINVKNY